MAMFRWRGSEEEVPHPTHPTPVAPPLFDGECVFRFAAGHGDGEVRCYLDLQSEEALGPPALTLHTTATDCGLQFIESSKPGCFRYCLTVPAAPPGTADDQLTFHLRAEPPGQVPPCRVELRRTSCTIDATLLGSQGPGHILGMQTRAALLWHGWKRFQALIGLKRFTTGRSGSDVLVFQPLLRPGVAAVGWRVVGDDSILVPPAAATHTPPAWGSCQLVKTGALRKVRREWEQFQTHLASRLHPFMSRCEEYLTVQPAGEPAEEIHATLISSFLGGDLLQVEPFESFVRGTADAEQCIAVLDKLFTLTAPWYAEGRYAPLGEWHKVIRRDRDRLILFGRYDLSRPEDQQRYREPFSWDVAFIAEKHLCDHWLGKVQDGLLYRLLTIPVHYSLIHGDLQPRNFLVDEDNVWLLDFSETGTEEPTLLDFTKLEVFLRLWCLDLGTGTREFDEGVAAFETRLLDIMRGTESTLEPVRDAALRMGADPEALSKLASCILWVRRRAAAYTTRGPDRRDYLAVLFLTVLQTFRYAMAERQRLANYRMLLGLAWLLEDVLSGLTNLGAFPRDRLPWDYKHLITADWLAAPGAPARVAYVMKRKDGRQALPFLAATRGVLQNPYHHLDVFDHTLLVLGNLEELLRDPLAALCAPARFQRRAERALRRHGLPFAALRHGKPPTAAPDLSGLAMAIEDVRKLLSQLLDAPTRLLLKWLALLHDVGKPASRSLVTAANGLEKVQFRGHEAYGAFVVAEHLPHLFPEPATQRRLGELIKRHHVHHGVLSHYLDGGSMHILRDAVVAGREDDPEVEWLLRQLNPDETRHVPDFPLLILHGFADLAASDGPQSVTPLGQVAELDILLLAVCARFPRWQARQQTRKRSRAAVKRLGLTAGPEYGAVLRELTDWLLLRTPAEPGEAHSPPSDDDLNRKAREIAGRLSAGHVSSPTPAHE
jgi:hypothetical protein